MKYPVTFIKRQSLHLMLLILSIVLFSLSFPGYFNRDGIAFFSFIAIVPMFIVVFRLSYIEALVYGFIYGLSNYLLFNFWFKAFDPAAFAVAPGIHGLYFMALFPLIRYLYKRFPRTGYLAISIVWLSYEVFKSTNAVGFSYGLLAQSMYRTQLFTGIVDIVGSYGLSILLLFPGLLIVFLLSQKKKTGKKEWLIPGGIYLILLTTSIIYTQASRVDYSQSETLRMSLVQHNLNCWLSKENAELYIQAYDHLEALSKEAEKKNTDVVVWSETAFVPAIEWHKKWRPKNERERYDLIMRMEEYLRSTNALYIIGNNESFNKNRDKSYNSAYLFNKDQIVSKYRKINLVPFTEQFPYPEKFPWLYNYVLSLGASQMEEGKEQVLFNLKGVKSTLLICYEDSFPNLPRKGVKNGSNLLVNITNDAWTSYPATALQHLAAASLRTIENRRSLVRAGTTGFTGVIDPNGVVLASLPLFTKAELTYDVPIYSGHITIYTKYGYIIDYIGYVLLLIVIISAILVQISEKRKIAKKKS